ncbi:hypothetical protein QTO34_015222, partial [Cnephaeus nilssonii]
MPTAVEVDGTQIWLHHSQLLHQETAWILATSGLTREIPSLGSTQARRRLDTCRRGTGLQSSSSSFQKQPLSPGGTHLSDRPQRALQTPCELSVCAMAVLRHRRGLWGSELTSRRGPSKAGELGACLLRHQAFQKPLPCRRLLKGMVHQRTGTQLPRDQKQKRGRWVPVRSGTRPFGSLRHGGLWKLTLALHPEVPEFEVSVQVDSTGPAVDTRQLEIHLEKSKQIKG